MKKSLQLYLLFGFLFAGISYYLSIRHVSRTHRDTENTNKEIKEFIPTHEWQEILEGQSIPRGLHVKMDFETHKKYAKLMDDDNAEEASRSGGESISPSSGLLIIPEDKEVLQQGQQELERKEQFANSVLEAIQNPDPKPEVKESPDQMKERVLLGLPQPLEELKGYNKLSETERRRLIQEIWDRRQKELNEAMKKIKRDLDILMEKIPELRQTMKSMSQTNNQTEITSLTHQLTSLVSDLNWLVMDIDNAHDFVQMKGDFDYIDIFQLMIDRMKSELESSPSDLDSVIELLNHIIVGLGSIFKHQTEYDTAILNEKVMPLLFELYQTMSKHIEQQKSTDGSLVDLVNKVVYCMGCILRGREAKTLGQFIVLGGHKIIYDLIHLDMMDSSRIKLKNRVLILYTDLFVYVNSHDQEESTMKAIKDHLDLMNVCPMIKSGIVSEQVITNIPVLENILNLLKTSVEMKVTKCYRSLEQDDVFISGLERVYQTLTLVSNSENDDEYYPSIINMIDSLFPSLH